MVERRTNSREGKKKRREKVHGKTKVSLAR